MEKRQIFGLVGAVMLFIGAFAPLLHRPIVGSMNYIQNGKGDGIFILIIAALAIYYVYKEKYREVRIAGILSLGLVSFTFFTVQQKIMEMENQIDKDLASNPFRGLANAVVQSVYLEWGFGVLFLGGAFLVLSGFMREKTSDDIKSVVKDNHSTERQPMQMHKPRVEKQQVEQMKHTEDKKVSEESIDERKTDSKQDVMQSKRMIKDNVKKSVPIDNHEEYDIGEQSGAFFKKNKMYMIFGAFIIALGILIVNKESKPDSMIDDSVVIQERVKTTVAESYADSMGWGKASPDISIEPVNIRVGKMEHTYDDFSHPFPVVELSVKNTGAKKLNSFGVNWVVKDIDNMRVVGGSAQPTGSIDPNWTSSRLVLSMNPSSYSKLLGNNPINFRMSVEVYVSVRGGMDIELYKTILNPDELDSLPKIGY